MHATKRERNRLRFKSGNWIKRSLQGTALIVESFKLQVISQMSFVSPFLILYAFFTAILDISLLYSAVSVEESDAAASFEFLGLSPKAIDPSSVRYILNAENMPVPWTSLEPPAPKTTESKAVFMDQKRKAVGVVRDAMAREGYIRGNTFL